MNWPHFFLGRRLRAARAARLGGSTYNWSNYAPDDLGFEREFGVTVRYGVYESNEEMLAKALTGNSGWDVVFPSNYLIQPMRQMGLLGTVRHEWLKNTGNLEARFQAPSWDPKLEYCVPYMWGGSGIVFDRKLNPALVAWSRYVCRPELRKPYQQCWTIRSGSARRVFEEAGVLDQLGRAGRTGAGEARGGGAEGAAARLF